MVKVLLAVEDHQQALAHGGPALDVLEHWVALLFQALQLPDLQSSMSDKAMELLLLEGKLNHGLNIREPLAQAFKPNEWPVRGISALKQSPVEEFRDYYESRKTRKKHITVQHERRRLLLEGQVYTRAVWLRNGKDCRKFGKFYVFRLMNILVRIEMATYDRWKPNTMRVHLDLTPEGQTHPNSIIRGKMSPIKYQDPARRLGIKISGVLNGTCWESLEEKDSAAYQHPDTITSFFWARQEGNSNAWVARWNKIVDWLERKDERIIRPRRCYLRSTESLRDQYYGWRKNDLYTLHPEDTDNWKELHTSEQYVAFNNDKKKKEPSKIPFPTTDQLTDWRAHWYSENAPAAAEVGAADEELARVDISGADDEEAELEENPATDGEEEELEETELGIDIAFSTEGEEPDAWDWV
ncbi:hypothetical protein C7974DRAFT_451204 [Boeremia exigua]|uniref:uncharacterized protein n=1 Tax=Boeremia exigua TaxID=749465 RepID=UPI001E8D111E|nr:uncharacterized protein C7974DRAFT_451204 [Boeremia exigua]KAH6637998.1 hypothetical protein C7974DRAFT_451204 [Boeremia exigua]